VRNKGERSTPAGAHVPVLLTECLTALGLQPGMTAVDCTLGFAGHSKAMLKAITPGGRLIALDLDGTNIPAATESLNAVTPDFHIHHGNFAALQSVLHNQGISEVNGILADLGMSSMQIDDPSRGFSFRRDGPLDMRMDTTRGATAAELLQTLDAADLATAFRDFGDEPAADAIAAAIVEARTREPITTTAQLTQVIDRAAPVHVIKSPGAGPARKQEERPAMRVFQALRILVNRELANLSQLLRVLPHVLAPGGVTAIISFHSGEDRLIKQAFRDGLLNGAYEMVSDDPIRPGEAEKTANPRSRSAKLRVARRAL
jgi:16S rRNA (cytosine1402-N4)-methyltransferase